MMYPFRILRTTDAPSGTQSAVVAKRRLRDALLVDRSHSSVHRDDSEGLLIRLLQEDLCPRERRSA
ncbi:MAG: hypothetical protein WCF99_09665 [Chloroflexales bacterium]